MSLDRQPSRPDRERAAPVTAGVAEDIQLSEWVSGWFSAEWMGERVGGYARLSEGLAGEVIAALTLMMPAGVRSHDPCPVTDCHLRFDPARNTVDYIVYSDDTGWSLEATVTVDDDFIVHLDDPHPGATFQRVIEACPAPNVHPLSHEQAQVLGWLPCDDDPNPPPLGHLWRPVALD